MIQRKLMGTSFWIWSSLQFAVVFSIIVHSKSDSRCFLVNGGSSVSFFVSEDAPIGYNLGTLEIQGDVTHDIILSLKESTAPVRIESGTKNVTLTRKLDKEGIEGPSTVTFTVLCDKRYNNEPSIHIPVTIRVSDVNDNHPKWIGGPFKLNISEQTLPGSTIISNLKAIDMDQHGPHSTLTFSALDSQGKPSSLVSFGGGGLEGRLILTRPLDYESMPGFNVTLRVKDQGTPPLHSDTNLEVTVWDADDQNPRFQHVSYSALLPTYPRGGTQLEIEPEPIRAFDQDTGINAPLVFSMPEGRPESQYFNMDPSTGRITLTRDIPEDQLNQPITLVLKAEQRDNLDRYALSTLNVGKKGNTNAPLHFVQPEFSLSVLENSPPGTILFTALTSRQADKNLRFGIEGDSQGLFKVGTMGQLILKKPLDYEITQKHVLRIWVTDGYQNASTTVIVQVLNVNDWAPRFRQSVYEFNVSADTMARGIPLGQIDVADGDVRDKLTLEIKNTDLIQVDNNGRLFLRNKTLVKREMMFLVVARDTGDPPREAFVPVVVRLTDLIKNDELFHAEFDMKIALIAALALVAFALVVGIVIYFGYCRKRRKIQSENFQKRVLERNISNPLAIHKLSQHSSSLRRSNKVRQMMNITSPILSASNGAGNTPPYTNGDVRPVQNGNALTPVDAVGLSVPGNTMAVRPKNVTWSPKVVQKVTPTPPNRSDTTRVTSVTPTPSAGHQGKASNGFELDPDTSVTPLETYRAQVNPNGRNPTQPSDTLQSNSSLTLYF